MKKAYTGYFELLELRKVMLVILRIVLKCQFII